MLGMLHYPDYPMDEATFGVKPGEHIPGKVVHEYLTAFAKKTGVSGRIRFNSKVKTVEAKGDDWLLSISSPVGESQMMAKRLVVATGLTSQPNMPVIPGRDDFQGPVVHAREALTQTDIVETAKSVVVLGGGKSAWDVAYANATRGVTVDMVVRKTGRGPIFVAPAYVTPFKKWLEKLVTTRLLTWFSPCTWGDEDGYAGVRSYLHGTAVGRFIVGQFWNVLTNDVNTLNGYDNHPELKKLKPWHSAFWSGGQLGIDNYPTSCFDLVRQGKIRPHVADVTGLTETAIRLADGETIETDAVICATGWKLVPAIKFLGVTDQDVGIPYSSPKKEIYVEKADQEILSRFPSLINQPDIPKDDPQGLIHPYRLYRFLVPPAFFNKRNIAIVGTENSTITTMVAAMQALWVSAYFDNQLDRIPSSDEDTRWQTMLHTQSLKWRYPMGTGSQSPDFVFDGIPYVDQLLADLGLQRWRKNGRIAEMTEPYGPEDYESVVDEWKEKHAWTGKS